MFALPRRSKASAVPGAVWAAGCRVSSSGDVAMMARIVLYGSVLAVLGCATPQRLSASIYAHEQRAHALDASGEHALAADERRVADLDRERLGGMTPKVMGRSWW
jgi:hypothetical protein